MLLSRLAIATICVAVSISAFDPRVAEATAHLAATTSPVLSPKGLSAILATYNRVNNQANETFDTGLQNEIEMGSAAQMDDAAFLFEKDAGYKTEGGATYRPFNLQLLEGSVPRQTSYPALALAVGKTSPSSCSGGGSLYVFEKSSKSAAWKLDYEPAVDTNSVPELAITTGGYGVLATSGKGLLTKASVVATTFELDLSSYVFSGTLGSLPKTILGTKGQCWSLSTYRPILESVVASGDQGTYSNPPTAMDPVAFRTADGGAIAMFTIKEAFTVTAAAGKYLHVSHTPGSPNTYQVPTGTFSSLTYSDLLEVAVAIPPATAHGSAPFTVVGLSGGDLPGSGIRVGVT